MGGYIRYAGTPVAVVVALDVVPAGIGIGYEVLAVEKCDIDRDGRCRLCGATPADPAPDPAPPPPPDTIEAYDDPRKAGGGGLPLFPAEIPDIGPDIERDPDPDPAPDPGPDPDILDA